MKSIVNYSEIAPTLKTGDLILMHGLFPMSQLIEFIEMSFWTHVGMIIRPEDISIKTDIELLFWESNSLTNLPDIITGKAKTGPMLVDLYKRLTSNKENFYDSNFVLRQLNIERNGTFFNGLKNFIPTVMNATFPSDFDMFIRMVEGRYLKKPVSMDKIYCSELVAASYMQMKVISDCTPPNAYQPGDFSKNGELPLLNRAFLYNQIYIEF